MLKQQLNLKLQQKLSPLQLQVIKMLEFPSIEMEERIREEMENNPALETDELAPDTSKNKDQDSDSTMNDEGTTEQIEWDDYAPDDDIPEYKLRTNNYSKDNENDAVIPFAAGVTFHETLMEQLSLCTFDDRQHLLAEYLIGNIGDDGYLRRDLESLEDDLAFQQGIMIKPEELKVILKRIQAFDPAGVGARNLKECLLLQLQRFKPTPSVTLALKILGQYFDHFARRNYNYILKHLNCTEDEFKDAVKEVLKLNPKPGSVYAQSSDLISQRITPDFILEEEGNILSIKLNNSNIPELRVNRHYKEMLEDFNGNETNQTQKMKDAITFARQKIDSARWFIDAIKQRNNTLMKTMKTILKLQYDFFLTGDEMQLKPMKLKDIADITGYDISTISRVSNSKYVDTKFGIYPLKHFFSETMHTTSGEIVSNKGIKKIIQTIIEQEDKKNPVTDQQLTEMLKDQGYKIARRTVAKYREKLHLPVARLRQEQF